MSENKCCQENAHQGHICILRSMGKNDEIEALAKDPTHICFTCGAEVNSPDNICQPMPMEKSVQ